MVLIWYHLTIIKYLFIFFLRQKKGEYIYVFKL